MYKSDVYRPVDGTINIVTLGVVPDVDRWAQRHTELYEYHIRTATALSVFEGRCCFVEYTPLNFQTLEYPKYRITHMAKKSQNSGGKMGSWNGIVSVPFNSPEKEQFMKWRETADGWETDLQDLIAQDYKLSLSHDNRSGAIMASLSCYNQKDPNYKYTMISRAPTPLMAVAVTLFKHLVLTEGDWNDSTPPDADMWG